TRVQGRLVDDRVEEVVEDAPELRAWLEAKLDQVVSVDGEVAQPVRARQLVLDHFTEGGEPFDLVERRRLSGAAALAEQVRVLVVDEVERELVAVAPQEAARPAGVALSRLEHVTAHDPHDLPPERVRIPQPEQSPRGEVRADLVVPMGGEAGPRVVVEASVRPTPADDRLAEVVEERSEPHGQREAVVV